MADLLNAIKTVRTANDETPEPALTAVTTTTQRTKEATADRDTRKQEPKNDNSSGHHLARSVDTPEGALHILRSQPDTNTLLSVLRRLCDDQDFNKSFSLTAPGSIQAQIVNTILTNILPSFWSVLDEDDREPLITCLTSVTGINAVVARLRVLASQASASKADPKIASIRDLVHVQERVLRNDDAIFRLWHGLHRSPMEPAKRQITWKEVVNMFASGKITSTTAQAEDVVVKSDSALRSKPSWLSSGPEYAAWLGRNIATLAVQSIDRSGFPSTEAASQILARSLSIGYLSPFLKGLLVLLSSSKDRLGVIYHSLPSHSRRKLVELMLRWLSEVCSTDGQTTTASDHVSAMAALLATLCGTGPSTCQILTNLVGDASFNASIAIPVRRAAITTIAASDSDELQALLEKTMTTFGDRLFIDHAPVLQQDSLAQSLLLAAGHLHRQMPMAVLMTARSQGHMQGTSNRLDTSGQRARWLGMVVATAVSSLVDKEGAKMDFHVEEMRTDEAKWYMDFVHVQDKVGTLQDFQAFLKAQDKVVKLPRRPARLAAEQPRTLNGKAVFGPPRPPELTQRSQTEVEGEKVTELLDEASDDEDDDLKPYAKPDSDPEDSDDDATLVNRNKPRPPVYIRDLMRLLNEDKDHDKFQLGIKHAATLIRRKANFGNEVKDHAEELLRTLCNLQDPFDTEDFDELRLQAMIAVLLSDIETLAPWLSKQVFAGEYSLAQRCIMLSALGLSGRELAGFKNEDNDFNPALSNTDFPSKRLPPRLHAIYAPAETSTKRLNAAFKSQEQQLIRPLALQAADKSTAHLNAVKVRTFSSRLEVERTKRKPAPNQLAKIFGPAFFYPLLGRYQQELAAYSGSSVWSSSPYLLTIFIKTLALLLHASGPATLNLPHITADFWTFLLSLRTQAGMDISVLESVLFGLLTLLEGNTDKRMIAEEQAKQLMETQSWVEVIFEKAGGSELVTDGAREEDRIRMLCAGVLVKTREVVEVYQKVLFGQVIE